jgi:PBSX family phage terminase large subunit
MAIGATFTPHEKQEQLLRSNAQFILALTGKQAGKTTVGAMWLIREIEQSRRKGEKCDWLICAPTVAIMNQAPLPTFLDILGKLKWSKEGYKEGKKVIELDWGSMIYVRSADDPKALESMTLKGVWFDEAGQSKVEAWENLQARVMAKSGKILMTTTPYACNWLREEFYKRAATVNDQPQTASGDKELDPRMAVYQWTVYDNPSIPRDQIEGIKGRMSPEKFSRDYLGNFTRLEGLVYPEFEKDRDVIKPFHIPPEWNRFGGVDFGFSSSSALLTVAEKPEVLDEKGKVKEPSVYYVIRELYGKEIPLKKMAEYIESNGHAYTLGDPRGAQEMAELTRAHGCRRVSGADNEVEVGIERLKVLFMQQRLKVLSCCPNLIDELGSYHRHRESDDKPTIEAPVKVHDHAVDALRYAFSRSFKNIYHGRTHHAGYQMRRLKIDLPRRSDYRPHDSLTGY